MIKRQKAEDEKKQKELKQAKAELTALKSKKFNPNSSV
jgi:hypothetical protein